MHLACCGRFRGWPVFPFLRYLSLSFCFLKEREEKREIVQNSTVGKTGQTVGSGGQTVGKYRQTVGGLF